MKFEGKLNQFPITLTTGMESHYENLSTCQTEQLRVSVQSSAQEGAVAVEFAVSCTPS